MSTVPLDQVPEGKKVEWSRNDGSKVPGYLFGDESCEAAVIVLQEWWGVTNDTKEQANYIASNGFQALVPDLYRGKLALEVAEAKHEMSNLDWPGAVEDLRGAARYLKENGVKKVGIVGFCMGGALSVAGSVLVDEIDCGITFYGTPSPELCDPAKVTKPMQAHFGEKDTHEGFADPPAAKKLEDQLSQAGVDFEFYRYPTVGHGFMNRTTEGVERKQKLGMLHDDDAIAQAWSRVIQFYKRHLKGESSVV